MKKIILITTIVICSYTMLFSSSNQNIGTTSAMFKPLVSPKVNSLGGAYATFTDADSLSVNPAGVAVAANKEISVAYTKWLVETNYSYLSLVLPIEKLGSFGLTVNYFNSGEIDEVDHTGNLTGETFSANGLLTSLIYSRSINEKISAGIAVKYVSQTIQKETASTPSLDLGSLFVLSEKLKIGVALQNLFGGIKFDIQEDKLPLVLKIGGSYKLLNTMTTAMDVNVASDNKMSVNFGVEYELKFSDFIIPIRAGYRSGIDALLGISLGAGIGYKDIVCLNLCWTPAVAELEQQTFNAGVNFKF
ncbi:MAG: PorV/PorQ family protein [Endomicrobia bacterium]|nr:PorV/PorQ family protein [Endomicrobiia bacterium]